MTPRHFCVAGVAQTHIHRPFTWQAWHNLTSTVVLRGRRGTHGTGWRAWTWFRCAWRPWRRATSAWQAWHKLTSTLISRGRRGTTSHLPSFGTHGTGWRAWTWLAGVALMALGGALGLGLGARDARDAAPLLRGRRGTTSHLPSFCVAGVAQPAHPRSLCVAGVVYTHGTGWRAWTWFRRPWRPWRRATSAWQAWHKLTSTVLSRGRRGTNLASTRRFAWQAWYTFHVAGVAQPHIYRRFAWQAWYTWHWGGALGLGLGARDARDAAPLLRGRRGTNSHPPSFHVAGVAQPHIYRRLRGRRGTHGTGWRAWTWFRRAWRPWRRATSAWQAWHLVTSTLISRGRCATTCTSTVALRGRRGTHGTGWRAWTWFRRAWRPWRPWRRATSAWQAWHKLTSTVLSRGRRGTTSHLPSFCVAGVVHMALGGALGLGLGARDARDAAPLLRGQAWHKLTSTVLSRGRRGTTCTSTVVLRGRRGTHGTGWRAWTWFRRAWRPWRRATSAWQAWHKLTSTVLSRGRRGTTSHLPSFCVAGVVHMALGGALGLGLGARDARDAAPLLRGRRGTWWHPPWFHVAGVAQPHIYRRFAWQAWYTWHWVARLDLV